MSAIQLLSHREQEWQECRISYSSCHSAMRLHAPVIATPRVGTRAAGSVKTAVMERPAHEQHDRDEYGVDPEFVDEALHPHPHLEQPAAGSQNADAPSAAED
jgi:hypothetical protein